VSPAALHPLTMITATHPTAGTTIRQGLIVGDE